MWPAWVEQSPPPPLRQDALSLPVRRLLGVIGEQAQQAAPERQLDMELDPHTRHLLLQNGLAALTLPPNFGGLGADTRTFCLCMRQLAHLGPAWPIMAVPHLCISVKAIEHLAPPSWRRRVFEGVVQRHELLVFAISEDHGSDLTAMQTRLSMNAHGALHLHGAKQWITNLGAARYAVLAVRHGSGMPPGFSLVLLDLRARGVQYNSHAWPKRCANGSPTGAVYLDNVSIEPDQVLGQPGHGLRLFQSMVQPGRLGAAAALIGMAEASGRACGEPVPSMAHAWRALDHAAACLDAAGREQTGPDLVGLCALVKHQCSLQAQAELDRLADICRRRHDGLPRLLLQSQHAAGLFRLLKGPGEVIGLQALASWLGRKLPPLPAECWQTRRWRWAAEMARRSMSDLSAAGGPLASPSRAATTQHLLARLHQCLSNRDAPTAIQAALWREASQSAHQLRHPGRGRDNRWASSP